MKFVFLAALFALLFGGVAKAEGARPILVNDVFISIPVPSGYEDVSEKRGLSSNAALFVTQELEPWEEANEFSDQILVYGIGLRPSSDAVKRHKFEEIFRLLHRKIEAQIAGAKFAVPEGVISETLINSIYQTSLGAGAYEIEITVDREDRKALLIDTKLVMPGVVTFPILEEISFVRVLDQIVVSHAVRLDISKSGCNDCEQVDIEAQLMNAGTQLRDGLIQNNP